MKKRRTTSEVGVELSRLLGGLTPQSFLRDYWHKRPLLVRQAIPGFGPSLTPDGLRALACREEVESRLVRLSRGRWQLEHGPFAPETLAGLPRRGWSLLVSGVNHWLPAGDALLHAFSFLPHARLDDLMVSLAPPGGGVGPHFDSYDVFLLQGLGRRRWEISAQDDLDLIEGAPLRILKRFRAEQTWVLEPGDMLYLPPRFAHNGVALSECMTWSIGFRAPTHQEIANAFLTYLQDRLDLPGRYADPDLTPPEHPAELPATMLDSLAGVIEGIHWGREEIEDFLGCYLSEPKPNVFFDPPRRPMSEARFKEAAQHRGIRLDPRTRLLFRGRTFYINGERCEPAPTGQRALVELADRRALAANRVPATLMPLLYEWYRAGFLTLA